MSQTYSLGAQDQQGSLVRPYLAHNTNNVNKYKQPLLYGSKQMTQSKELNPQNNLLLFDLNLLDIYLIFQKDGNKDDMKIKKQKMTAFL